MSIIAGSVSVPAGSTLQNVLQGQTFEFLAKESTVKAGWVVEAAGAGDLTATWKIGDAITVENAPVGVEAAIGVGINANTDLLYVDAGRAGARLSLSLTNSGIVANVVTFYFLII